MKGQRLAVWVSPVHELPPVVVAEIQTGPIYGGGLGGEATWPHCGHLPQHGHTTGRGAVSGGYIPVVPEG